MDNYKIETENSAAMARKSHNILRAILASSTAGIALLATPALAEDAVEETRSTSGEIVVTAQRREESILTVPISVASYSQEAMDIQGIRNISDISRLTPSLRFVKTSGVTGNLGANISIRGIASDVGAATTAIYIDDTPIQIRSVGYFSGNPYPRVFDLERVEVLRGPQGTLFGAGAQGGAVRFITPQPNFDDMRIYSRAEVSTTKNGSESYEAGLAVGGPLSDTLAVRLSAWHRKDGGWIDLIEPPTAMTSPSIVTDEDYNSESTRAIKVALSWRPSPEFTLTGSLYSQRIKADGRNQHWEGFSSGTNYVSGRTNSDGSSDRFLLPSLNAQYEVNDNITFIASTSIFERTQKQNMDYSNYLSTLRSGSPFGTYNNKLATNAFVDLSNKQDNFTAEARLQSFSDTSLIDWTMGVYFSRTKQQFEYYSASGLIPGVISRGFPQYLGRYNLYEEIDAKDKQLAGFASIDIKPIDGVKVTIAGRYTKNKFDFRNFRTGPVNSGNDTTVLFDQSENSFTPKFGVAWQPDDNNMLYASASKGFRQGGAQPIVDPLFCATDLTNLGVVTSPQEYKSDSVWAYEVGSKNKLFGGLLTLDANLYQVKWKGIQQAIRLPTCGFTFIGNLGEATSKGTDVSIVVSPTAGIQVGANLGYNKTSYDDPVFFDGNPSDANPGVLVRLKGQRIGGPSWTGSIFTQADVPLSDNVDGYVRLDYSFQNRGIATPSGVFGFDPGLYALDGLDNLSFRVGAKVGGIDASLFVDNLTNQNKPLARNHDLINSPLYYSESYRPRTIGITLQYRN
jgi:iron complex outermembrane recepter protein